MNNDNNNPTTITTNITITTTSSSVVDDEGLIIEKQQTTTFVGDDILNKERERNGKERITNSKTAIHNLMVQHDPILVFASKLLPTEKNIRNDVSALYAWCRRLDEICDDVENNTNSNINNNLESGTNLIVIQDQLEEWQHRFDRIWEQATISTKVEETENNTTVLLNNNDNTNNNIETDEGNNIDYDDDYWMDLALINCIRRYSDSDNDNDNNNRSVLITRRPFDDMIEGMKSDAVENRRIKTMEELETYAYSVAGTVSLMLLPILLSLSSSSSSSSSSTSTRSKLEHAQKPAIALGKAIQMINILRDAVQDVKLGRIYLPQDCLQQNNVDEQNDILDLVLVPSCVSNTVAASTTTTNDNEKNNKASSNGYRNVVQTVSLRAHKLLIEAEIGARTTFLLEVPFGILFVQIIIELYRDYLDELKYNRQYDNLTYNNNKSRDNGKGLSTSSINTTDKEYERVKISPMRKLQASFRAVIKVIFKG